VSMDPVWRRENQIVVLAGSPERLVSTEGDDVTTTEGDDVKATYGGDVTTTEGRDVTTLKVVTSEILTCLFMFINGYLCLFMVILFVFK